MEKYIEIGYVCVQRLCVVQHAQSLLGRGRSGATWKRNY